MQAFSLPEFRATTHHLGSGTPRFFPNTFDAETALGAFTRDATWGWESCGVILESLGTKIVVMQLPFFWQLISPLHLACAPRHIIIYPNEPVNMIVAGATLERAKADTVIIEARRAEELSHHIRDRGLPLPSMLIIHRADDPIAVSPTVSLHTKQLKQEVHLAPGIPLLIQCAILSENRFHLAQEWNMISTQPFVAQIETRDGSTSVELPFGLKSDGTCACGRDTYTRV